MHRVTRYEREVMAFSQELLDEELGMLSNIFVSGEANWLEAKHPQTMYGAYEHIRKDQFLLERFLMSADDYSLEAEHAGRILRAMAEQVDEESRIEQVEVSGVVGPVNLATVEEREIAWTSFMVAEAIDAMARAAVKDSAELAAAALSEARARSLGVMKRLAKMERVREILASDRPLPDDKTVENARYEAHISRQLYQALHELEALQASRGICAAGQDRRARPAREVKPADKTSFGLVL